jgi:hypothetical protein
MHGRLAKILAAMAAGAVIMSVAGCDSEFSFDPTDTTGYGQMPAVPTTSYVRKDYDAVKYPYFAMLKDNEKDAYSLICENLTEGNKSFECPVSIKADELATVVDSVLNDHPELFWVDNTYGYTYEPESGDIKDINFDFFDFADTPEKLAQAKTIFDSNVSTIVAQAMSYQSAVERELAIHDFICTNTDYDTSAPYNQSAYSVIVLHKSVCAGYAKAFQYLAQKAGITCYYVTGRTDGLGGRVVSGSNEDGSHSWDIVLLDGGYYNIDCLWDDTASDAYGSLIYPFFNLTDTEFIYHARINLAVKLPSCTATDYKYSNQFGPTIEASSITFADAA